MPALANYTQNKTGLQQKKTGFVWVLEVAKIASQFFICRNIFSIHKKIVLLPLLLIGLQN
jgi:hypothetical protein